MKKKIMKIDKIKGNALKMLLKLIRKKLFYLENVSRKFLEEEIQLGLCRAKLLECKITVINKNEIIHKSGSTGFEKGEIMNEVINELAINAIKISMSHGEKPLEFYNDRQIRIDKECESLIENKNDCQIYFQIYSCADFSIDLLNLFQSRKISISANANG